MKSFDDKRILVLMHQGYSMLEAQKMIQNAQTEVDDSGSEYEEEDPILPEDELLD